MHHNQDNEDKDTKPAVLASLRALLPPKRPLPVYEALIVAELQANRLLELSDCSDDVPVPSQIVTDLPRMIVEYDAAVPSTVSGASDWDAHRRSWVITLNAFEPATRQRFSLLHEYKHILDHYGSGLLTYAGQKHYGLEPEEYVAEYFAGCVLMPKRLVKRAWGDGVQRISDLAELFDVSVRAMEVRLSQLKLVEPTPRIVTRSHHPYGRARRGHYHRQLSANWPVQPARVTTEPA